MSSRWFIEWTFFTDGILNGELLIIFSKTRWCQPCHDIIKINIDHQPISENKMKDKFTIGLMCKYGWGDGRIKYIDNIGCQWEKHTYAKVTNAIGEDFSCSIIIPHVKMVDWMKMKVEKKTWQKNMVYIGFYSFETNWIRFTDLQRQPNNIEKGIEGLTRDQIVLLLYNTFSELECRGLGWIY